MMTLFGIRLMAEINSSSVSCSEQSGAAEMNDVTRTTDILRPQEIAGELGWVSQSLISICRMLCKRAHLGLGDLNRVKRDNS